MSNKKTTARQHALQALYQWQLNSDSSNKIVNQFLEDNDQSSFDPNWFYTIFVGVLTNIDHLDEKLQPLLDRDIEQVDPVERAILRLGAYELIYHLTVPYKVTINEAVELAKIYGAEQGHRYINGVLDKLSKSVRKDEHLVK